MNRRNARLAMQILTGHTVNYHMHRLKQQKDTAEYRAYRGEWEKIQVFMYLALVELKLEILGSAFFKPEQIVPQIGKLSVELDFLLENKTLISSEQLGRRHNGRQTPQADLQ